MNNDERTGRYLKIEYFTTPEMILTYPVHCFTSNLPQHKAYNGIWDTGSSRSIISQNVVNDLQLTSVGTSLATQLQARGEVIRDIFLMNIALAPHIIFSNVRVGLVLLPPGFDIIIGLDIITRGNFSLSQENGKTIVEFLLPDPALLHYISQ